MSLSPFDHPLLGGLLGDPELAASLTAEAELAAMLAFESALAEAEAKLGVIPAAAAVEISRAVTGFRPDMVQLAAATARDGVVVPDLVAQLRTVVGEPHARYVHHGATSQDVVDTALIMRLNAAAQVLDRRLAAVIGRLEKLAAAEGGRTLMGHTRMQRARPVLLARKVASWREPLLRHRRRLAELAPRLFVVQLGGAVGDRAELATYGDAVADHLADALGLGRSPQAWHNERDGLGEFASWLSLIGGSLGKLGMDIALMAQNEIGELRLRSAGRSSAMPEKSNPVAAEALVALGRFNSTLVGGFQGALIHENERSGSAWMVEWMILPQMVLATGGGLRIAADLLSAVEWS